MTQPFLPSRLYVICDHDVCHRAGWALADYAQACLVGGARLLQLRAKHLSGRALFEAAQTVVAAAAATGAVVVINDRADIARLTRAGGVHVGQDDVPPSGVRLVVGAEALVGLSTHTMPQLAAALQEPVDYVAVGPVFGTATKDVGHAPVGLGHVSAAAIMAGARAPVVAIGGITLASAAATIAAGAAAVAVISDLLSTGDPTRRVAELLAELGEA